MDDLEKALEEIVRNFLLHETKATEHKPKESGGKSNGAGDRESVNVPIPEIAVPDDEFVSELYQCLTERGVLREVHALLRQRLVEILKGSYPQVVASGCDDEISGLALRLFEDFICCHNLLFTYSVLSSETGGKLTRDDFGKLSCADAEKILEEIHIPRNSGLSQKILKQYSEKQNASLLECVLGVTTWGDRAKFGAADRSEPGDALPDSYQPIKPRDSAFFPGIPGSQSVPNVDGGEERYLQLQILMERDKEAQIKMAIQRFREEESQRIRDELATKLKFDFIAKEKELLRSYDERVAHMKSILDREKEIWIAEKARKEKELFTQKQDLIKLMEHVKEKKKKLQEALENIQVTKAPEVAPAAKVIKENTADSSVTSEDSSSDNNRKYKLMKNIELEVAVKRLQAENALLKARSRRQTRNETAGESSSPFSENDLHRSPKRFDVNDDKIALLQYTVEKQTDELENMKKQLRDGFQQSKDESRVYPTEKVQPAREEDLESFLAESKRRFAEIEKKAEQVGSSLKEVFKRSSSAKLSSRSSKLLPLDSTVPMVPKIPSILKQPLPSRQTALATEVLASGLSTTAETLKSFLLDQACDKFSSKAELPGYSHTLLLQTSLEDHVVMKPVTRVATVTAPSTTHQPFPITRSPATVPLQLPTFMTETIRIPLTAKLPLANPVLPAAEAAPRPTLSGLPDVFAPPVTLVNHKPEEVSPQSESQPPIDTSEKEASSKEIHEDTKEIQGAQPVKSEAVTAPVTIDQGRKEQSLTSNSKQISESTNLSMQPEVSLSALPPFALPSQRSAPAVSEHVEPTSKPHTVASASSSGALIQTKIPTALDDARRVEKALLAPESPASGGDALTKTKLRKGKISRSSSDNSISFPDVSHAEGDTFEFMAEEDFWAI